MNVELRHQQLLEPVPAVWARAGCSPGQVASSSQDDGLHCLHCWQGLPCQVLIAHQEVGVQDLAQGHFDMQLSSAPGELGFEPTITSQPALPAELQPPPLFKVHFLIKVT